MLLVEGLRGRKALGRSFELVKGRWWKTFGTLIVGFILAAIISTLVQGVFLIGILFGDDNDAVVLVLSAIAGIVGLAISTPFQAALLTVVYFDLRVRKEGFDLELLAQEIGAAAGRRGAPSRAARRLAPRRSHGAPFWPPPARRRRRRVRAAPSRSTAGDRPSRRRRRAGIAPPRRRRRRTPAPRRRRPAAIAGSPVGVRRAAAVVACALACATWPAVARRRAARALAAAARGAAAPAAAIDPDRAREQARDVLAQRRFQPNELPSPLRRVRERIGDALREAGRPFEAAYHWVAGWFPGGPPVLITLLAGAILAGTAALVTRSVARRRRAPRAGARARARRRRGAPAERRAPAPAGRRRRAARRPRRRAAPALPRRPRRAAHAASSSSCAPR